MSRFITASGGAINLARRTLPVFANHIVTTPLLIRSSLIPPILNPSLQSTQVRYKWTWTQWLGLNPTSLEELQTVYDACVQSPVFGPRAKRLKPTFPHVEKTFLETPGLQPQDWETRRIPWQHAVAVATRLHQERLFTEPDAAKALVEQWPRLWEQAKAEESDATREAVRARRVLKVRKQMELDSDAAEGIKSKRRPLTIHGPGSPPNVQSREGLRRLERHGREIIVDKQVKKRANRDIIKTARLRTQSERSR